jgi:putative ABC transport system permease protein
MLALAWRNLFRHRGRTLATLASIVFGVAGLILSGGFVHDIFVQLAEALIHSQTGHLQVMRIGYFEGGTRFPERFRIDDRAAIESRIAAMPEVSDVMGRIPFSGLLNNGRSDWAIVGEGVESDKEARLGSHVRLVAGRQLRSTDEYGVSIGQGVAQALKLRPGDRATLVTNTAEGALNSLDVEVVGVFETFSKEFDARALRMSLPAAQELMSSKSINSLVVALKDTADTDAVARRITSLLRDKPLEVKSWQTLNDFYDKTVALYERQFGVLQLIILAMVLLSVANSTNMTVWERLGEFGTMRALGNRRRTIIVLILVESVLLGIVGATLGVLVGVACALAISAVGIPMPPPPNANLGYTALIRLVPDVIVMAFGVGLFATVLATILPALRVSREPVADALRANV